MSNKKDRHFLPSGEINWFLNAICNLFTRKKDKKTKISEEQEMQSKNK